MIKSVEKGIIIRCGTHSKQRRIRLRYLDLSILFCLLLFFFLPSSKIYCTQETEILVHLPAHVHQRFVRCHVQRERKRDAFPPGPGSDAATGLCIIFFCFHHRAGNFFHLSIGRSRSDAIRRPQRQLHHRDLAALAAPSSSFAERANLRWAQAAIRKLR
jgi:hypothetical protein